MLRSERLHKGPGTYYLSHQILFYAQTVFSFPTNLPCKIRYYAFRYVTIDRSVCDSYLVSSATAELQRDDSLLLSPSVLFNQPRHVTLLYDSVGNSHIALTVIYKSCHAVTYRDRLTSFF